MRGAAKSLVIVVTLLGLMWNWRPVMSQTSNEPTPNPRKRTAPHGDQGAGMFYDLGVGALPLQLSPTVDPYTDIQGDALHQCVRDLAAISLDSRDTGDLLWGRICGRPSEERTVEYVKAKFDEIGLEDVRIEEFPLRSPQWWPTGLSLTLVGGSSPTAPQEDRVFRTAMAAHQSAPTPPEGMEAPVVYVGHGTAAELFGKELKGKIALLHCIPEPSVYSLRGRSSVSRLVDEGVAGIVAMVDLPGNMMVGIGMGKVGKEVSWLTIGGEDGMFIKEIIESSGSESPPRLRMNVQGEMQEGWLARNVYGLLRGTTDEYVVIFAHTDGWFEAANDNASGVAAMLALARHFSEKPVEERRRNMLFVGTAGHHPGSAGSSHLINNYRDILEKTVVALNCEHCSSVDGRVISGMLIVSNTDGPRQLCVPTRSPFLINAFVEAVQRYGVVVARKSTHNYLGDAARFHRVGIPCLSLIEAPIWYHTDMDTPEHVSPEGLECVTRAFAHLLDKIDDALLEEIMRGASAPPR